MRLNFFLFSRSAAQASFSLIEDAFLASLVLSASSACDTSRYRGQQRANLANACLAAASESADLSGSTVFHTLAAFRAKPEFLDGGGTWTKPDVVDRVLEDVGGTIVDESAAEALLMAFQASRPVLWIAILL